jgi:dTMP kinase
MLTGEHSIADRAIDPRTMALLFAADRTDHIQREVEPALLAGKIVVSDRWYHSSLAYQALGGAMFSWVEGINWHIQAPKLTIFLSVDPRVAAERRVAAGRVHELFDDLETQLKVEEGYRKAIGHLKARGQSITIVDGGRAVDVVADTIYRSVIRSTSGEESGDDLDAADPDEPGAGNSPKTPGGILLELSNVQIASLVAIASGDDRPHLAPIVRMILLRNHLIMRTNERIPPSSVGPHSTTPRRLYAVTDLGAAVAKLAPSRVKP